MEDVTFNDQDLKSFIKAYLTYDNKRRLLKYNDYLRGIDLSASDNVIEYQMTAGFKQFVNIWYNNKIIFVDKPAFSYKEIAHICRTVKSRIQLSFDSITFLSSRYTDKLYQAIYDELFNDMCFRGGNHIFVYNIALGASIINGETLETRRVILIRNAIIKA